LQEIAELVFLSIFTLEMVMKIIAYGLYRCGPPSYLKNRWNLLDGFIVVIGYVPWGVVHLRRCKHFPPSAAQLLTV
jgi:hypothetical protein